MEIDHEKYERSHYVLENTGRTLKTNSKRTPNKPPMSAANAEFEPETPPFGKNELKLRSSKARQKRDKLSARASSAESLLLPLCQGTSSPNSLS
jgi:hypothetical protein